MKQSKCIFLWSKIRRRVILRRDGHQSHNGQPARHELIKDLQEGGGLEFARGKRNGVWKMKTGQNQKHVFNLTGDISNNCVPRRCNTRVRAQKHRPKLNYYYPFLVVYFFFFFLAKVFFVAVSLIVFSVHHDVYLFSVLFLWFSL